MAGDRAIRSAVVLGAGVVGLSAALAFARALPQLQVRVVETRPHPCASADRAVVAWPAINRFHESIGLDEAEVVRAGAATWRLGTRITGWPNRAEPWVHIHGLHGVAIGPAAFHEAWARARRSGRGLPFDRYAAGAVLAEAGRFVHPEGDSRSPLSTYDYALRPDPDLYRALLAKLARSRGVELIAGELRGVELRPDGAVEAIVLGDGRRLAADLFLDCSGPGAHVLAALDGSVEGWSDHLPNVTVETTTDRKLPPSSSDALKAEADGWTWSAPSPDRTVHLKASFDRDGLDAHVRPGRRREPWRRNVLALGDAAVQLDPLWGVGLLLAHRGIRRALDLLPGRSCDPVELGEYNRRTGQEALLARDFLTLWYSRHPGAKVRVLPASLAHTVDQFRRRGRLPVMEEDPFGREAWIAALIGLGVVPEATGPMADEADPGRAEEVMQDLAAGFATLPEQLPDYARYLTHCGYGADRGRRGG